MKIILSLLIFISINSFSNCDALGEFSGASSHLFSDKVKLEENQSSSQEICFHLGKVDSRIQWVLSKSIISIQDKLWDYNIIRYLESLQVYRIEIKNKCTNSNLNELQKLSKSIINEVDNFWKNAAKITEDYINCIAR